MSGDAFAALLARPPFYKMTGSGNDFVFLDARAGGAPAVVDAALVARVCARGSGVGADGLAILDAPAAGRVRIAYFNNDGSRASLCGNATLCAASLAVRLGAVPAEVDFAIETDAGVLPARVDREGAPRIELEPVTRVTARIGDLTSGEGRAAEEALGFAVAGVPHVVALVADVDAVDLDRRGPELRRPTADRPEGANVNFVSPADGGRWYVRTFERGVEGETQACGTGAVACAAVLQTWGRATDRVALVTRSGRELLVGLQAPGRGPTLAGEGRLVFTGQLAGL